MGHKIPLKRSFWCPVHVHQSCHCLNLKRDLRAKRTNIKLELKQKSSSNSRWTEDARLSVVVVESRKE